MNRQTALNAAAVFVWASLLAGGFVSLWDYSNRAGSTGSEVSQWPSGANLSFDSAYDNLVLFLHPRCPCSHATLAELVRLIPRLHGRAVVTIIFSRPAGVPDGWERGPLWSQASAIPGARVILDPGGHLAALFGAETSGLAALYSGSGRLLYRGGLTPGRGHEGDNFGSDSIAALAQGKTSRVSTPRGPVFGCALHASHGGA
jgi:hypothetical protein